MPPGKLPERCEYCGRFISDERWYRYNGFAGHATAFCDRDRCVALGEAEAEHIRQRWAAHAVISP